MVILNSFAKIFTMFYLVKAPWILQKYYWECVWKIKTDEKKIYLTFDDGPTPDVTDFVLEQLEKHNAEATFFCIGEQVKELPTTYENILSAGHAVGNHSFSHPNGWKTDNESYLRDVQKATEFIDSHLFRPPYGRIKKFQLFNLINGKRFQFKPIMWHVLSADFDTNISPEQCYLNVIKNTDNGSLVVFHDSEKAFPNMKIALPKVLSYYSEKGFRFEKLDEKVL